MAPPDSYGEYEGLPIIKLAIEVRNTAGGLNAAMRVHGGMIHPGEHHTVAYDVVFDKHRYDPMKDPRDESDAWCLVAIGSATAAAILSAEDVAVQEQLQASREEQLRMADEKNGRAQLDDDERGLLATAHGLGEHNEHKADGCPLCEERVDDDELDPAEREVREKLQDGGAEPKSGRGRKVKDDPQA